MPSRVVCPGAPDSPRRVRGGQSQGKDLFQGSFHQGFPYIFVPTEGFVKGCDKSSYAPGERSVSGILGLQRLPKLRGFVSLTQPSAQ